MYGKPDLIRIVFHYPNWFSSRQFFSLPFRQTAQERLYIKQQVHLLAF